MEKQKTIYVEPQLIPVVFDTNDIITASCTGSNETTPPDVGNMDDGWC